MINRRRKRNPKLPPSINYYFLRYSHDHLVEYLHLLMTTHTLVSKQGKVKFLEESATVWNTTEILWPDRRESSAAREPTSDHNEFRDSTELNHVSSITCCWDPTRSASTRIPTIIINTIGWSLHWAVIEVWSVDERRQLCYRRAFGDTIELLSIALTVWGNGSFQSVFYFDCSTYYGFVGEWLLIMLKIFVCSLLSQFILFYYWN